MLIRIAMTAAPRPDGSTYMWKTLSSLRTAGFNQHVDVYCEPGTPHQECDGVAFHIAEERRGCLRNWIHAATEACKSADPDDWILLLQDDVIFRRDAAKVLRKFINLGKPATGFASLYTNKAMMPIGRVPESWGLANYGPGRGYWGALAGCWPVASLQAVLLNHRVTDPVHSQKADSDPVTWRKVDVIEGFACLDLGLRVYTYFPSLCDHIGTASTIGRDKIPAIAAGRRGVGFRSK